MKPCIILWALPLITLLLSHAFADDPAPAPERTAERKVDRTRVTVSTIAFGLPNPNEDVPRFNRADRIDLGRKYLDVAGERGSDVALLPELFATKRTANQAEAEPVPGGPASTMMAEAARKWRMYVLGSVYESDGGKTWNTVPVFDREGNLIGKFRKVHLPDEELSVAAPGDCFPVFETDFGRVGALVCWDIQFPESMRCLALQGAEIVFWPTMYGGDESTQTIVKAQAILNRVYVVSSNYAQTSGGHIGWSAVVAPSGKTLAETGAEGVATAVVNLDERGERPDIQRERMPEAYGEIVKPKPQASAGD